MRRLLRYLHDADYDILLLSRFYGVAIAVNVLAIPIDIVASRVYNAAIEGVAMVGLIGGAWMLLRARRMRAAAWCFFTVLSAALFALIAVNHFATMSVVFVLLLPLAVLPFLRLRTVIAAEAVMIGVMGALLYVEARHNPLNPLVQNPMALYNLGYAALMIFVFGLLYHLSIVRTFDELDAANRQQEMLLKEVHHRVKNNLNVIASIIGLQASVLDQKSKEPLLKTKIRIESIAMVHAMLYRSKDFEKIDFETYVRQLCELLLGMYDASERIRLDIHGHALALPLDTMVQLGIVISELTTNSVKHAFSTPKGSITISLEKYDGAYRFRYSDDGVGIESDAAARQGSLGLRLVELAARQMDGRLRIDTRSGVRYTLMFRSTS